MECWGLPNSASENEEDSSHSRCWQAGIGNACFAPRDQRRKARMILDLSEARDMVWDPPPELHDTSPASQE